MSAYSGTLPPEGGFKQSTSSHLVALARDGATLGALDLDAGWVPLGSPDRVRVWTDDYASIVPLLRWW